MEDIHKFFNNYKSTRNSENLYIEKINNIDDNIYLDQQGNWTIFMCAIYNENVNIVKRCIALGADLNKRCGDGETPLYQAYGDYYSRDNYKIFRLLLEAGADPNIKICNTPLIFSVYMDVSFKKVDLLLRYGAMVNEFHKYKDVFYHKEVVKYFIKILAKRRWVYVKCVMLVLSLHKRAVERVNHPDRLKQQGVFVIDN